jgi:hypothetical protein
MHYIPKDVEYEADASGKQPFMRRYRWAMMILAWAALDVFELIFMLSQIDHGSRRDRIILAFSARMAGID